MGDMIEFKCNNVLFKYRIVGIALHNDRVLLQKSKLDTHWALPGGRAEMFEDSIATLKREMLEELKVEVSVGRLIWIVENFYEYTGQLVHEVALYYLIHFPPESALYQLDTPLITQDNGYELTFQWHPIGTIEQLYLLPEFLQRSLKSIPMGTEHVVVSDFQEKN
ncbi:NUDIX hydrolase [candidate division KSB1 bacterium]|nr:NUDIX hydrolase [candidate division KSB1 bacterium]